MSDEKTRDEGRRPETARHESGPRRWDFSLTLGPAPTNWGRQELERFYESALRHAAISRMCIGDIGCTKRGVLSSEHVASLADLITAEGREAVFTTPPVVVTRAELDELAALAEAAPVLEANNVGVVRMWKERFAHKPLVLGPYLDVYNGRAARFFAGLGAGSVVAPVDIELPVISQLSDAFPGRTEVVAFGRPALAFSWRCYTARASGKLGRDCTRECYTRREVVLETLEGEKLLAANGKAIYPVRMYAPLGYLDELGERGVSSLRIEPAAPNAGAAIEMLDTIMDMLERGPSARPDPERFDTEYMTSDVKRSRGRALAGVGVT